jgi:hypothetical protein
MTETEEPNGTETDNQSTGGVMGEGDKKKKGDRGSDAAALLGGILAEHCDGDESLLQGLRNLDTIPDFSTPPPPVKGKKFAKGVMGFRKFTSDLKLALACGTAQVRYLELGKFIAMVENAHAADNSSTIMLQNFKDKDDHNSARGQVMGRLNMEHSAIHVIQGLTGRVIHNPSDIALFDVYYIDRIDLTSFYLAAKAQVSSANQLEAMIATHDGWKAFDVPLDPLNPYGVD